MLDKINGIAHVTGGGIAGNLERILPAGHSPPNSNAALAEPPIFAFIQQRGAVSDEEMFRVFNMGVGLIIAVPATDAAYTLETLAAHGATTIGTIAAQSRSDAPPVRIAGVS